MGRPKEYPKKIVKNCSDCEKEIEQTIYTRAQRFRRAFCSEQCLQNFRSRMLAAGKARVVSAMYRHSKPKPRMKARKTKLREGDIEYRRLLRAHYGLSE